MTTTTEVFDKAKFKQRFYPANPFTDGVVIQARQLPIEVFILCIEADLMLETLDISEKYMVPGSSVQVDQNWFTLFLQRKRMIRTYIKTALRDKSEVRCKYREQILAIDDPQLHQDLIEADEALGLVPGVHE